MTSRRGFIKSFSAYAAVASTLSFLSRFAQAAELKLIDITGTKRKDPDNEACVKLLKPLGYVEDLAAALKSKQVTNKKDIPGVGGKIWKPAEQTCDTCSLYKEKRGPTESNCLISPKCLVHAKGSCNTWAPKA